MSAAYGARFKGAFVARRGVYKGLRSLATPLGAESALTFAPALTDATLTADVVARANWYLADLDLPVHLPGVDATRLDASAAPYVDPALVRAGAWTAEPAPREARVLLHHVTPATLPGLLPVLRRSHVVDPSLSYTSEFMGYRRLRAALAPAYVPGPAQQEVLAPGPLADRAVVLGTGPSAELLDPTAPEVADAQVRIVCNSAVGNRELVAALRPTHVVFADPVFYFGPSRYTAAFRADLVRTVQETGAAVVVPEHHASLLLAHHPELRDRLVAIRTEGGWNVPSLQTPTVRDSGNILTLFMLPLAFALARHVEVAGCDGRKPDEKYFWTHGRTTQYAEGLMRDVFESHPGFFRHRSYTDYYERHCAQLEELAQLGEAMGRTVRGLTPSWIPALARRGAPVPS